MILSVNFNKFSAYSYKNTIQKTALKVEQNDSLTLSGANNPMKSYVSFGYCWTPPGHYSAVYKLDSYYAAQLEDEPYAIFKEDEDEKYSLEDENVEKVSQVLMSYSNSQNVKSEMAPSYTQALSDDMNKLEETLVEEAKKLGQTFETKERNLSFSQILDKTTVATNPINGLIAINDIVNMIGAKANKDAPKERVLKSMNSAKLYSILILLEKIEKSKLGSRFSESQDEIDELIAMIKKALADIYGEDIFDKNEAMKKMGMKLTTAQQNAMTDFLIENDSNAKRIVLPAEFVDRLTHLINKQNEIENRTLAPIRSENKAPAKVAIHCLDHDHTHHHHGHTHSHSHTHDHSEILHKANNAPQKEQATYQQVKRKLNTQLN